MAAERHGRDFWQRLSAAVDDGATIASIAQRYGVRPRTLAWWRWKLQRETKKRSQAKFLPVVIRPEATAGAEPIVIAVCNDVAFRVPVGSDVGYVAALVAAVRNTC